MALLLLLAAQCWALDNELAGHPSPYLAMHGDDPVAWQDWGEDAVAKARETGRMLFISSGYFSCHWCHVMQRESYRDPEIAAFLNAHFIPVKLDRELHGALDDHLIRFLEDTQGQAGWPLNVFLTPEGYPVVGATYVPPERFLALITRLHETWTEERRRLRNLARRSLLQRTLQQAPADAPPLDAGAIRQALLAETLALADVMEGGFGQQSRFPMAPQLTALLEVQASEPNPGLAEFLQLTLDNMASEGLRDHLAGGFFRYTVDPSWSVPHFEKMLYTQAQLSLIFMRAADVFERPDYADVARDTLRFVATEMVGPQGGYIASFSAVDDQGVEGGSYLWQIDEIHALLGEADTALARRYWRLQDIPVLDGGHLPRRGEAVASIAKNLTLTPGQVSVRLAAIQARLLTARRGRGLPADRKELAGWNGLMLAAFSEGARRWDDPQLASAARRIRDYLRLRLWDGTVLRRALDGDAALGKASLADYAYVAYGLARHAELSGDPADTTLLAALLRQAWRRYHGPTGWRMDDEPLIPGMTESRAIVEGALPSPSALLIALTLESDDPAMMMQAAQAAEQARALAQQQPFWYAGHTALLMRQAPSE